MNIASLQLVRIGGRQKEIALRLALGASRLRLASQFLAENLLLVCLGGAFAIPVAVGVLTLMAMVLPESLPRWTGVGLDLRSVGYLSFLTVCAGLFFGLVPIAPGSRRALAPSMNEGSGRTAGDAPRWERWRKLLVVAELGMAVWCSRASAPAFCSPSPRRIC